MMIAPGALSRMTRFWPNSQKAISRPRPGPGFEATMKKIDLPSSAATWSPSG